MVRAMTWDDVLERVQGSIDLMRGRADTGWRRLDVSADGFWNSFLAIPVCLPALLVIWLSHAGWLQRGQEELSVGHAILALALIEVVVWVLTVALFALIAGPMRWGDRFVATVIAVNWASVAFAYVRAIPAGIALLIGIGDGVAFITLIVALLTLVAYGRLLTVSLEKPWPIVAGVFIASVALGFVLSDVGHSILGLSPEVSLPGSETL